MDDETPLHSSEFELNGEVFNISIYSNTSGRFFAQTCLGEGDLIITDGLTVPDALKKHEDLLPLAISTRELTQSYLGRPRGRRP